MADPIDSVVSVEITRVSTYPTSPGFGTPLFFTYHTVFADSIRRYSSIDEMADDGFTSSHDAYRMAAAAFAQNPNLEQVAIGRKTTAPSFVTQVTVTSATEGQKVQFKVVEPVTGTVQQVDYTILAAATTTTVATAIELLTEAFTGVDSTSSSAVVSITPTVAGRKVHVYDCVNCTVAETTADADYDAGLTALQLVDDDWYAVVIDSSSAANVEAVATWAEVSDSPKIFLAALSNTTSASTALDSSTAIADALIADSLTRTALIFAFDSDDFAAAAWAGVGLTADPGSITWANQELASVTAANLTTTQRNELIAANINYYIPIRGKNVTQLGVMVDGEYIDVIHGLDALNADIQTSVFNALTQREKVPYTVGGFTIIENAILGALRRFEPTNGSDGNALLVFKSGVVKMPVLANVSLADKAARFLRNVRFEAQLQGAIHSVSIRGNVTL